jgi:hypothetical protein
MIVVSFETKKDQKTILEKATRYFVDTVGLKLTEEAPCCLTFEAEGTIGYVRLTLSQKEKKFEVKLETREFDHWIKKFGEELK